MIAKPGEPPVEKKTSPSNSLGPSRIPRNRLTKKLLLRGVGVWNSDPGGVPPPFRFEGWTNFWLQVHTPKKLPHDLIGTNKQTNKQTNKHTWLEWPMYFLWNNNWWVGPWIYLLVKYRRGVYLSRFVCTKLGLRFVLQHMTIGVSMENMVIHMESPHGELLIDRLCSAFPSEWNMLYFFASV